MRSRRPPVPSPRPFPVEADGDRESPFSPQSFESLGLSPAMLRTVEEVGFESTTPIQTGAIPHALLGRDVIGQAHTGSGKTAAFAIPILERLAPEATAPDAGAAAEGGVDGGATETVGGQHQRKGGTPRAGARGGRAAPVQALVLCPTRELAVQVHDEISRLAARHPLRSVAIYGGDSMGRQLEELGRGPQIVVATPGRLRDHLQRRTISLAGVRIAVLDEADRMLDMGFAPDVEAILRECPRQRQTMLFSATMPDWVRRLASRHMQDPITVEVSSRPEIPDGVRQLYVRTNWSDKVDTLCRILDQPDVTMALIFVETKRTADILTVQLERRGYSVGVLHGDLTQRERDGAMRRFVAAHVRSLIATNVAARGLDIDDISHVVNYDVPATPDEYLHRVGRTGRAGRSGVAITLITPAEILKLRDVERHARTRIEPASLDEDFPAQPVRVTA